MDEGTPFPLEPILKVGIVSLCPLEVPDEGCVEVALIVPTDGELPPFSVTEATFNPFF